MSRILKIGGTALAVLLVLFTIIFIFFPGLPTYFKVKHDFEYIDTEIGSYKPVSVPDDFKEYSKSGLSIKVPDSFESKETEDMLSLKGETARVLITVSDSKKSEKIMKDYAESQGEVYDKWENYKYGEADYREFFKKMKAPFPNTEVASSDILWFNKGGFTAKDCLKLRGKNKDIFLEFAEIKDDCWGMEDTWVIEKDGFTMYVCGSKENDTVSYSYWTATVFPENSGSEYYFIMIRKTDEKTINQIISSIKLDK